MIDRVFWGDSDESGNPDPKTWWRYGVDLDGAAFPSTTGAGHCKPYDGAKPADVIVDGPGGVDDSWARSLMPIFVGLDATFGADANATITSGGLAYAIRFAALPSGDASSVSAELFVVTGLVDASGATIPPPFDGSPYAWRPLGDWIADASVPTSTIQLANGWVSGGTWVSGEPTDVPLILGPFPPSPLPPSTAPGVIWRLRVHHARVLATVSGSEIVHGRIVGILSPDELDHALDSITADTPIALCYGTPVDGLDSQLAQAADILLDGTQDPTRTCDGISFGIGFHAVRGELGVPAPPLPPQINCPNDPLLLDWPRGRQAHRRAGAGRTPALARRHSRLLNVPLLAVHHA